MKESCDSVTDAPKWILNPPPQPLLNQAGPYSYIRASYVNVGKSSANGRTRAPIVSNTVSNASIVLLLLPKDERELHQTQMFMPS